MVMRRQQALPNRPPCFASFRLFILVHTPLSCAPVGIYSGGSLSGHVFVVSCRGWRWARQRISPSKEQKAEIRRQRACAHQPLMYVTVEGLWDLFQLLSDTG